MTLRYAVAACQTDLPNPLDRAAMRRNTDRMLAMIEHAVAGAAPFLPVRLVVFPEFAHAAPVYPTVAQLLDTLAVPIPNEHTDRLVATAPGPTTSTSRAGPCWRPIPPGRAWCSTRRA